MPWRVSGRTSQGRSFEAVEGSHILRPKEDLEKKPGESTVSCWGWAETTPEETAGPTARPVPGCGLASLLMLHTALLESFLGIKLLLLTGVVKE